MHVRVAIVAFLAAGSVGSVGSAETIWRCVDRKNPNNVTFCNYPACKKGKRCVVYIQDTPAKPRRAHALSHSPPAHRSPQSPSLLDREREPSAAQGALPFDDLVHEAARKWDVLPELLHAVIRVESNYNPRAVSAAGAMGLMQLMPATARQAGVSDPFDPRQNIEAGARVLRALLDRFDGDLIAALAAYHAGQGAVRRAGGIPYRATRRYVRDVLSHFYALRAGASNRGKPSSSSSP